LADWNGKRIVRHFGHGCDILVPAQIVEIGSYAFCGVWYGPSPCDLERGQTLFCFRALTETKTLSMWANDCVYAVLDSNFSSVRSCWPATDPGPFQYWFHVDAWWNPPPGFHIITFYALSEFGTFAHETPSISILYDYQIMPGWDYPDPETITISVNILPPRTRMSTRTPRATVTQSYTATPSPQPSPSQRPEQDSEPDDAPIGVIIAIIVGGVVLVVGIVIGIVCCVRSCRASKVQNSPPSRAVRPIPANAPVPDSAGSGDGSPGGEPGAAQCYPPGEPPAGYNWAPQRPARGPF
jgi:hypothetical protein